jgi:cardiolipin synthase
VRVDRDLAEMTSDQKQESSSPTGQKSRRKRFFAAGYLVFQVLGFVSAIEAVMATRTAQGAVAWSVSLVAAPVVAVPAYWLFGRSKFEGYLEARRENQEEIDGLIDDVQRRMDASMVDFESSAPNYDAIEGLSKRSLTRGNRVELLVDGEATFESILRGISEAERTVLVQFYIVHDDGLGRRLADAMIERARAGVMVAFLYDEVGSAKMTDEYVADLEAAGVRVSTFNTTQGWRNQFQINFRNHRKIVVVDGRTTWIGGHNVGDEYLGLDDVLTPWRDTHVRVDGPMAIQAQGVVAEDWYWAQRELLPLDWDPHPVEGSDVKAMVMATGPADPLETAGMFFVHALNAAQERIWITAPYFVPDDAVIKALMLASLRGVDVRILLPGLTDNRLVKMASYHYIDLLEGSDVHFCEFQDGFIHQKVMLVDHAVASVGTHNFDNRSFRLNFEVAALVWDEPFAREVEAMLSHDLARCEPVPPGALDDKPFWWRLGSRVARLAAPVF